MSSLALLQSLKESPHSSLLAVGDRSEGRDEFNVSHSALRKVLQFSTSLRMHAGVAFPKVASLSRFLVCSFEQTAADDRAKILEI